MASRSPAPRWVLALAAVAFVLSTTPLFTSIYRGAAFNTTPRDDYSPFLLALVGERGPSPARQESLLSGAPYGYRILSVAAAIPFYYTLPLYVFSNLEDPDIPHLRATEALALVSYLAMLLTAVVVYLIAVRRLGASPLAAVATAGFSLVLMQLTMLDGVDPLAILIISLLILSIHRPLAFAPLIVLSAATNEKILIIFSIVFALRGAWWLVERRTVRGFPYLPQAVATGLALAVYVSMRLILRLPGGDAHTDPGRWLEQAQHTIGSMLTAKGLFLNGIPLIVMAILVCVALWVLWRHGSVGGFSRLDAVVAPVLLAVGIVIGAEFTVGRLVVYSFPLFLPLLALAIDDHIGADPMQVDEVAARPRAAPDLPAA